MDRVQFDNIQVLKQIEYINDQLKNGQSLRSISNNLGMSKTTIRDRFIKKGYIFNSETRQYIKNSSVDVVNKDNTNLLPKDKSIEVEKHKSNTIVRNKNNKELQSIEDFNTIKNDLLELITNKHEILEMLKDYKSNTKIIDISQLDINYLPEELQKDIITKSIKIYNPIYKLFDEVCSQYNSIKKQDLMSLALLEFYNKYNK